MLFGLTSDIEDDGISGSHPLSGQTLDQDEVDDVVESPEDTIAAFSDLGNLGCELEDPIVVMNGSETSNDAGDLPDPDV